MARVGKTTETTDQVGAVALFCEVSFRFRKMINGSLFCLRLSETGWCR